jgi:hypothetical protein
MKRDPSGAFPGHCELLSWQSSKCLALFIFNFKLPIGQNVKISFNRIENCRGGKNLIKNRNIIGVFLKPFPV